MLLMALRDLRDIQECDEKRWGAGFTESLRQLSDPTQTEDRSPKGKLCHMEPAVEERAQKGPGGCKPESKPRWGSISIAQQGRNCLERKGALGGGGTRL